MSDSISESQESAKSVATIREVKGVKSQYLVNVFGGWLNVVINALFSSLILPINLHFLGKDTLSVSVVASSILFLLHYLNFGLSPTLLRFFSRAIADKDYEEIKKTSSTAQLLTCGLGLLGALIFLAFMLLFYCDLYNVPDDLRFSVLRPAELIRSPLFILFCGMAFSFVESFYTITFGSILQGCQRLDYLNYIRSSSVILRVILLCVCYTFVSRTLASLGLVIFLIAAFRVVVQFLLARRLCGNSIIFSYRYVDFSLIPKFFSFGVLAFTNSICMALSIQIPVQLIGIEMTRSAVVDFGAANHISSFLGTILAAVVVPLTPLAYSEAKKGGNRLGAWATSIGQVVSCFGCCALLVLWLFGTEWYTAWLGPQFAWVRDLSVILASGIVLASVQQTNFTIALGADTIAPIAFSSIVMAILVSATTYIGLHWSLFGLTGVVWTIAAIRFVRNVVFIAAVYAKRFHYNYFDYTLRVYVLPLCAAIAVGFLWKFTVGRYDLTEFRLEIERLLAALSTRSSINTRLSYAIIATLQSAVASVVFLIFCWFTFVHKDLKKSLFEVLRKKFRR